MGRVYYGGVERTYLYRGRILNLALEGRYEIVEHKPAVAVIALREGRMLFVRQMRPAVGLARVMEKGFLLARRRVEREAERPGRRGMGTTLTAFLYADWIKEGVVGHIGDSRAYRFGPTGVFRLTEDHSWVAERLKEVADCDTV